jgi:glucose-1-phosphate thymidylyltransferase
VRSVYVLAKGVVVVPNSAGSTGPSLGATRASSLQRVANRPILCHVLDALLEAGVQDVAIALAPELADEVAGAVASEGPSGLHVSQIVQESPCEPSSLRDLQAFVGDARCILHRGDGLLGEPILHSAQPPAGAEMPEAVVLVRDGALERRRLRLVAVDHVVKDDAERPLGVAGACLLGRGVLASLAEAGTEVSLLDFAAITDAVAHRGGSTLVRVACGWRHFEGDTLDLLDMNRALLDRIDGDSFSPAALEDNRFEGRIVIHPTAHVSSSSIVGPVLIGAHAWISDSYIGPHTSIAERVRIEGAELERSIVLADACVLNVGGRLVASVVGRRARIFRDFAIPRALRMQVGDDDEVALC